MTTEAPPLIDLTDVGYSPDGVRVLSGITLQAQERRIGIVGRNGSGKTSLARVLSGLIAPTTGRVRIAGVDVARDRKAALRHVGILFQNPDHQIIFPTVEEEIAFGLIQMGQSKAEAAQITAAMLARFGRSHWSGAAIHRLSQGQRQLVCLMSVLAMAPRLIILDEPFAGLDIPTTLQLSRVLEDVDAHLVHITHEPAHLSDYDRALWIENGEISQDGPPALLLPAFRARMNELGGGDDLADLAG